MVPTYAVARIRPKLSGYVEYKRINLTLSVLPRYLLRPSIPRGNLRTVRRFAWLPVSGFRPSGETSLSIGLDESGHVSFTTTYKLGVTTANFSVHEHGADGITAEILKRRRRKRNFGIPVLPLVPTKNHIRAGLTRDKMPSITQVRWICRELDRRFRSTTPIEHTNAVFRSRIQEEWPLFKQRRVRIDGGVHRLLGFPRRDLSPNAGSPG